MTEIEFSLSDPAVRFLHADVRTMQRWEILRRSQRPHTVAELAEKARASTEDVQRSLDKLVSARLVARVPASRRLRAISYRATVERLLLRWDRNKPEDVAAYRALSGLMRTYSRTVQDDAAGRPGAERFVNLNMDGVTSVMLLDEDAERVREVFRNAYSMLTNADARARGEGAASEAKPFHVSLSLTRLDEPELPMAEMFTVEAATPPERRQRLGSTASKLLSPREHEVAELLVAGRSRPRIAMEIGLSPHTVASMSKAIYRKLGVKSRAELAVRMQSS
jgi:DNA-binding NarL/FixJ family response regulator/DNA-binding MarR family transcriptional regulator